MGTDIHLFAEVKRNGVWVCTEELRAPAADEESAPAEVPRARDFDRHYTAFAILAGVHAETRTQAPTIPISFPRGLPTDCSEPLVRYYKWFGSDAHDSSWLSLRELTEFDWDGHKVLGRGFVPRGVAEASGTELGREPWYISETGAHHGPSESSTTGVEVTWTETYREAFGKTRLDEFLHSLQQLGSVDSVRIVFWFDS